MKHRPYIIAGEDYSGLGWAKRLMEEGYEVIYAYKPFEAEGSDKHEKERFMLNGSGLVEKLPINVALKRYANDDATWVFDSNHLSDVSETLREAGCRVFGASALSHTMEHDRAAAIEAAKEGGLGIPDMIECKTVQEGLKYIQAHEDCAYVFKPNDSNLNYMTFVPQHEDDEQANKALQVFLENFSEPTTKGFILQERKKGVEVNFELWLNNGEPWLATCGLESKRLLNWDLGEHCGCSQDIIFKVDINCEGIQRTVAKVLKPYKAAKYTGFVDVNVICGDQEVWFLENCNRFGYSAHPNFFHTIAMQPFGEIIDNWIDGKVSPDQFRKGFGASINLYIEHPRIGWPILIDEKVCHGYYPYDLYCEGDNYLLSGYSQDVGVYSVHDYTIQDASRNCLDTLKHQKIWYPDIGYRTDLADCDHGKRDYPSNPQRRFEALECMGLLK